MQLSNKPNTFQLRILFITKVLWGHRANDIHPSIVLGLRPMPRPIITCKKINGDLGNPEDIAEDNSVLGQPRPRQKKSDLLANTIFQILPKKKISTVGKHTGAWWQNNSRKSCCLPIKCSTTNTLATLMWRGPLNSMTLATPTHRRLEEVFDGTSTQVVA